MSLENELEWGMSLKDGLKNGLEWEMDLRDELKGWT